MGVNCYLCPRGSPKTDYVKLVTLNGRDRFVCLACIKRRDSNANAGIRKNISDVQKESRDNGETLHNGL